MYVKLFASLYQGTLRGRSHPILVFTNLLANADQYGHVDKHWAAIADEVGLTVAEVKEAVKELESPDPESRTQDEEGRRIVPLDEHRAWGWRIVNYGKYRQIRNEDDRREQNRLAQERFRNKSKPQSAIVSQGKQQSAHTEAEAEAKEIKTKTPPASRSQSSKKTSLPQDFGISDRVRAWALENKHGNLDKHLSAFKLACQAKGYTYADWDAAFMNAIRNNWAKLDAPVIAGPKKLSVHDRADLDFEKKYGTAESLGHLMQKLGVAQ